MSAAPRTIGVNQSLLAERKAAADRFRQAQADRGTLVVQLISSPGAGKTALLEATARHWAAGKGVRNLLPERPEGCCAQKVPDPFSARMGVLVGDIETDRDARRLAPLAPSVQITTGGACHLELPLVERALPQLGPGPFDFLFIEDVGNLVCPAGHDVGGHCRVILLSVTEGDDKPGKYPKAFRTSQALVISKADLLPYVPFSVDAAAADAQRIQPELAVFTICALTGLGVTEWCHYLAKQRERLLSSRG